MLLLFSACDSSERLITKCADYSYEVESLSFEGLEYVPKKLREDREELVESVLNMPLKSRMRNPFYSKHFTSCELEYRIAPSTFKSKW